MKKSLFSKILRVLPVVFLLSCISQNKANCQLKWDYEWIIALNDEDNPGAIGYKISFNDGKRKLIETRSFNSIGDNNAMICNNEGELLLYANGCEVMDTTGGLVQNGDSINPGDIHDTWCQYGIYPGTQNSMILIHPNFNHYFYLHKDWVQEDGEFGQGVYSYNQLFTEIKLDPIHDYSIENKNLKVDSLRDRQSGYSEAILHENGSDWWIIDYIPKEAGGLRLNYKIDEYGIYLDSETEYENQDAIKRECSAGGQAVFSPRGDLYALYCPFTGIDIFNFNRSTGEFSNHYHFSTSLNETFSGLAFSPNGRFLYVSSGFELHQFDLWADDGDTDQFIRIAQYDGYLDPFPTNFAWMQIGPDCKIYMTSTNGVSSFHVINNPNEKGQDCNFVQHGFELPIRNGPASIPNVPVFRFDGDEVCDPTITSVFDLPIEVVYDLELHPNPTTDDVLVGFPEDLKNGNLYVKSMSGQVIYQQEFDFSGSLKISLGDFETGMYVIEVVSEGKRFVERVVKVD